MGVSNSYKNYTAVNRFAWWANEGDWITLEFKVIEISFIKN